MDATDDQPLPDEPDDDVVVTVVSTTWRAAIVEVRAGDDVRWVSVPRRHLDGFVSAAAAGGLALLLRQVLASQGEHAPTDVETEFGVFDTRPSDRSLLTPERHVTTGRYHARSNKDHRDQASMRPRARRPIWLAVGAAAVATTAGIIATSGGDDAPATLAPLNVSIAPPTNDTVAGSVDGSVDGSAATTVAGSVATQPANVVFPVQLATSGYYTDFTGSFSDELSRPELVLAVNCSTRQACELLIDDSMSQHNFVLDADAARGDSSVTVQLGPQCPPEWNVTLVVDLAFEFDGATSAPSHVTGTIVLDQPLIQSGNTVCFGRHFEWDVDALAE